MGFTTNPLDKEDIMGFLRRHRSVEIINLRNLYMENVKGASSALRRPILFNKGLVSRHDKKVFVIDFRGDIMASQADGLTQEVNTILLLANPLKDEVLVRLTSPGGAAHMYGYAASQLERLRDVGIKIVVAVDKVAASGGYWMASVADRIIAAPYAIIGSIGVVAEFPNLHDLLNRIGVDYKQYTSGEFKRTVSTFGEITEEGEAEFKRELEDLHDLFKLHITKNRELDLDVVANGKHWPAIKAKEFNLVDDICTSDDYILQRFGTYEVVQVRYIGDRKNVFQKVGDRFAETIVNSIIKAISDLNFKWLV